jgi:hypothetical protein
MFLDYVTSEIEGDAQNRKRILKRGALSAIGIVMVLYMAFNLFLVSKHPPFARPASDDRCSSFFSTLTKLPKVGPSWLQTTPSE